MSDNGTCPEVDLTTSGPPMPSPEVFLTCLAQVVLPPELRSVSWDAVKLAFCGNFDAVVRIVVLFVPVFVSLNLLCFFPRLEYNDFYDII